MKLYADLWFLQYHAFITFALVSCILLERPSGLRSILSIASRRLHRWRRRCPIFKPLSNKNCFKILAGIHRTKRHAHTKFYQNRPSPSVPSTASYVKFGTAAATPNSERSQSQSASPNRLKLSEDICHIKRYMHIKFY